MDYIVRELVEKEYHLFENFLYEAIFVPENVEAPPTSIIKQPELQVYLSDFGKKKDDIGLVAEVGKKVVGAVWVRIMEDISKLHLQCKKRIMQQRCIRKSALKLLAKMRKSI